MTKRKFGLLITSVVATGAILAACGDDKDTSNNDSSNGSATEGGESTEEQFTLAMVTDVGGVDDKSFNQSAWEGVKAFGADNGLTEGEGYAYLQSQSDADYTVNLNSLIRRDFDLVFGVGYLMADAIGEVAAENPDSKLVLIDSADVTADNLVNVLFKEHEGAFLAGVVAAKMSESGKIGFVGGVDIPVINRFEAGFVEGAKAVNPDIQIEVNYTGAFDDASKGKIAANAMYSAGADIVFHAAGGTGNGVFAEAKERKQKDPNANIWVIGVDADQYEEGKVDDSTNVTLTSMLKGVNNAVVDMATRAKNNEFPGGETIVYGLAEDGVGLADSRGAIPQDVLDAVEEYKAKIVAGEIKVSESLK